MKRGKLTFWLQNGYYKIGFIKGLPQRSRDWKTFCIGRVCVSWWEYEDDWTRPIE